MTAGQRSEQRGNRYAGLRQSLKKLRELDTNTVRLWVGGLIVVAIAVVVGIGLLSGGDSDEGSPEGAVLSESQLLTQANTGIDGYELTSTADGQIYIRYLSDNAEAGGRKPDSLVVGTYAVPEARQALARAAKDGGEDQRLSQHGGYEALGASDGHNAYVVFDDQPSLQIEIFSPKPGEAADLATSGSLRPLG